VGEVVVGVVLVEAECSAITLKPAPPTRRASLRAIRMLADLAGGNAWQSLTGNQRIVAIELGDLFGEQRKLGRLRSRVRDQGVKAGGSGLGPPSSISVEMTL
jgi:hypothetical protein